MSEMIQRVAKSIRMVAAEIDVESNGEIDCDPMVFSERFARAAIEAMREPTEAMKACPDFPYCPGEAWAYWEAMIDEALK